MTAIRMWHQSVNELDQLEVYQRTLEAHAGEVLGAEAEVDVRGLRSGSYGGLSATSALSNAYAYHRILDQVLDNAVEAERAGYSAFVVGSFSEPLLREIRSAVDIPVASLTESALLVGCSLGKLLAPISNAQAVQWMVRNAVEKHGLGARVLEVQAIEPALDEPALALAYNNPEPVIEAFTRAAKWAIAKGADVIIPAEGVLAELLYAHGVRMIGRAAVMDVFGTTWAYALMLVRLWSRTGLRVGRSWHYRRDDPDLVWRLHARAGMRRTTMGTGR
jgi:allantoin racemase